MPCFSPSPKLRFQSPICSRQLLFYGLTLAFVRLVNAVEWDHFSQVADGDTVESLRERHETPPERAMILNDEPAHVQVERLISFDQECFAMTPHECSSGSRILNEYPVAQLNTFRAITARCHASSQPSNTGHKELDTPGSDNAHKNGLRLADPESLFFFQKPIDETPCTQFITLDKQVQISKGQSRGRNDPSENAMREKYSSSAPSSSLPPKKRKAYLNDDYEKDKTSEASPAKLPLRQLQKAPDVAGLGRNNLPECIFDTSSFSAAHVARGHCQPIQQIISPLDQSVVD